MEVTTIIGVILIAFACLVIGYNLAWRRYEDTMDKAATRLATLEVLFAELHTALTRDPTRTGIDIGKEYILNEIATLIEHHRAELAAQRGARP